MVDLHVGTLTEVRGRNGNPFMGLMYPIILSHWLGPEIRNHLNATQKLYMETAKCEAIAI